MKAFTSVDQYIDEAAQISQPILKEFRRIVTEIAPAAEERISYGMPGYFLNGALVYFAAFKNHVSLFGAGSRLMDKHADELKGYITSKGTIQFQLNSPMPWPLIKKLIEERLKENLTKKK